MATLDGSARLGCSLLPFQDQNFQDCASMSNAAYWRRKLSAFLHDSPDKVIDLLDHEGRARSLAQREGFDPSETARKESDHAASAADRLPWPRSRIGEEILCRSEYDATDKSFRHPLGNAALGFEGDFKTALEALDVSHTTKPVAVSEDPRAAFFTVWRFWQNWASAKDERFAFLPADTRLPDHTIWNHLSITSALQGCYGGSQKEWSEAKRRNQPPPIPPDRPAFLLFTLGPVQEFIAPARNTRDLWSASYLLSYLIGAALRQIALDFGPDHILFPNLLNQPILDLLLRNELWNHIKTASGAELWKAFGYYSQGGKHRLLIPSLPNRFLAILPSKMAEHQDWNSPDLKGRTGANRYAPALVDVIRRQLESSGAVRPSSGEQNGTAAE
jgi:CRISPR-associated protein Cmr2